MRNLHVALSILLGAVFSISVTASVIDEPDGGSYHFSSTHRINVNATAEEVWPHLLAFDAWMTDFLMTVVQGKGGAEGAVYQLYEQQDFQMQLIKVVPAQLLVMANLPSEFRSEHSTGIGIMSLTENDGVTTVTLVMSRRYTFMGDGDNASRQLRVSPAWVDQTRQMWESRFLTQLKTNVEGQDH